MQSPGIIGNTVAEGNCHEQPGRNSGPVRLDALSRGGIVTPRMTFGMAEQGLLAAASTLWVASHARVEAFQVFGLLLVVGTGLYFISRRRPLERAEHAT